MVWGIFETSILISSETGMCMRWIKVKNLGFNRCVLGIWAGANYASIIVDNKTTDVPVQIVAFNQRPWWTLSLLYVTRQNKSLTLYRYVKNITT